MDNRYQDRQNGKNEKTYGIAIVIFIVGIAALAGAIAIGWKNLNPNLLLCEIIGLLCLIGMLIVCNTARRRAVKQKQQRLRNPYSGVDSHEIDKILDLINDRENKRRMAEAYAKGEEMSAEKDDEEEDTTADENELTYLVIDDEAEEKPKQEEKKAPEEKKEAKSEPAERKDTDARPDKERKEDDGMSYDDYDRPKRRPEGERRERDPYYDGYYEERSRQRAPRDRGYRSEYDDPRRRRPAGYDQYYDDYYDDRSRQRGSRDGRERDPRDRDGYGRTYYNEYGEPVRRRPPSGYDDRRPRRRRPDGRPEQRRPRYEDEERRPTGPVRQENELDEEAKATAAAETAPVKEEKEYDSEFIPIVIPYDDYDPDEMADYHTRHRAPGTTRKTDARGSDKSYNAAASDDDDMYEDERVVVRIPDDDEYEHDYSEEELRQDREQRRNAAASRGDSKNESESWKRTRHEYVPDYEEEAPIVSLPRDEEYDEYLERKREEEKKAQAEREKEKRRAERRASGKVVLTIANVRRHKIRRRSRKYKNFRASVTHLGDYLNSFSAKMNRR